MKEQVVPSASASLETAAVVASGETSGSNAATPEINQAKSVAESPGNSDATGTIPVLVAPYAWFFSTSKQAKVLAWLWPGLLWLCLYIVRRISFPAEPVYWAHELMVVPAFTFAACAAIWLYEAFGALRRDLGQADPQVRGLIERQYLDMHGCGQLIVMPILVSGIAIGIRYFCSSDIFEPFTDRTLDYLFSAWLFAGFCAFMYALVPIARFSRIVRVLGEAAESGRLGRLEIRRVAAFYLHVSMLATLLFFLGGIVIFDMHLIYTYHGNPWPGMFVFSGIQARSVSEFLLAVYRHDSFIEIFVVLLLYGGISLGTLIYFLVPQWNVHSLLKARKDRALERAEKALDDAEKRMMSVPGDESLERYSRQAMAMQAVENLPEWPFDSRGFIGFLAVILLPAIIVFFKEIILETIVGILTK